jgi:nucleoside-diphosphate-sugar epimerase
MREKRALHVLLTGSSGWLGRFLAPRLRAEGHKVMGIDVAHGIDTNLVGSIADKEWVQGIFREYKVDAVIHAAALHKPDIQRYPNQAFFDVNIGGTLNLLDAAIANGCDRFVFTSTTSLMISEAIRAGKAAGATQAAWLNESFGPLEPRNVYGVTKRAAEQFCRLYHREHGLPIIVLRTSRFFPEEDDTHRHISGRNLKANEFLNRRLTVEDAAEAHVAALNRASEIGFGLYIISASPPFERDDAAALIDDAAGVVSRYFPDAAELFASAGWQLPQSIDRVYDPGLAERELGFRCRTDFRTILDTLRQGSPLPFRHDPTYVSPKDDEAISAKGDKAGQARDFVPQ